jgi:hypothetical protein
MSFYDIFGCRTTKLVFMIFLDAGLPNEFFYSMSTFYFKHIL